MVIWHRAARQFPGRYRSVLPDQLPEKPLLLLCCICCFPNARLVKLTGLITRLNERLQPVLSVSECERAPFARGRPVAVLLL